MEVLFCFDGKYEQHFGAAVTSLILNNLDNLQTVHIITKKITSNFQEKIHQLKTKAKIDFLIYEVEDAEVEHLKVSQHISSAAYYRLLAAEILPNNIDKILYLDSDLIVNGSILELYNYDISDYIVAANGKKVVTTKKRLELNSNYYFNSGVMLINLKTWRNLNIGKISIQLIRNHPEIIKLWDQDALNKVIDGQFLNVDQKWNSLVDLYSRNSQVNEQSIIIHFIGSLKPWHIWCISPTKELYWTYLKQSPWSNSSPETPKNFKQILSAIKAIFKQLIR
ncbi:glycosyltransferase family 8 protein [Nodularia harveyana UHCC-0300]|uniref:Glycosyltransferase family 8 protein n=1 Tax=Nodularia harveyana UHCC-0300 TaxID=2974287 RepID=A0ABU5UGS8_9CYAN|nr:glycosyltransferase family 8 protein [Nodularia harveyana]MEA5582715.1 glycosyltransferase family 8 protein [Nodularia harveyana UHCC-0300]